MSVAKQSMSLMFRGTRAMGRTKKKRKPVTPIAKWGIVRGDLVQVIAGKDKGKQGTVIKVARDANRVHVDGVALQQRAAEHDAVVQARAGVRVRVQRHDLVRREAKRGAVLPQPRAQLSDGGAVVDEGAVALPPCTWRHNRGAAVALDVEQLQAEGAGR